MIRKIEFLRKRKMKINHLSEYFQTTLVTKWYFLFIPIFISEKILKHNL